jgi:hypothetical protein
VIDAGRRYRVQQCGKLCSALATIKAGVYTAYAGFLNRLLIYLPRGDNRITELILWGIAVSYLADAPAAVGWVMTGGFWLVC